MTKLDVRIDLRWFKHSERMMFEMSKITNKHQAISKAQEIYNQLFNEENAIIFDEYATNLDRVLRHFQLEAYEVNMQEKFANIQGFNASEVSGFLLKNKNGFRIYIDRNQAPFRKRFTIAHEIGHYALKHVESKDLDIVFRGATSSSGDCPEEVAANAFAAELLMPGALIKHVYHETNSILKTAIAFGVSESAVKFRLKNLGVTY